MNMYGLNADPQVYRDLTDDERKQFKCILFNFRSVRDINSKQLLMCTKQHVLI